MVIVITQPEFFEGEAGLIVRLLRSAIDLVHIRKPNATAEETERLVREIPSVYYSRLVLHDHFQLVVKYHLYGVHLNSRNPQPPVGWKGSVSRSCHSLDEVKEWKPKCDYVSLSPIFDSISKKDYPAAFSEQELAQAETDGIIDEKVMALGGVTFSRMNEVLEMGFGGGMIMGDAWNTGGADQQRVALTIAGSDTSAGAGIQQDLKTMSALGVYGATVITAVTSQNTMGVTDVLPLPAETVASQLDAVLSDLNVVAIKIGMIPTAAVAHVVAVKLKKYLAQRQDCAVVYDPVMVSTSSKRLMEESCLQTVCDELIPLCTLVTPNLPEASILLERPFTGNADGVELVCRFHTCFLVKGGHGKGRAITDMLFTKTKELGLYLTERVYSRNLHGTGCTLSSAIASHLLLGNALDIAIQKATQFVAQSIARGQDGGYGKGNGPILVQDYVKTS